MKKDSPLESTCSVTILQNSNILLCKRFYLNSSREVQVEKYALARFFSSYEVEVKDIYHLNDILKDLENNKNTCIVRGKIAPNADCSKMLRRHIQREGQPATLLDVPRRWIQIDVDGIPYHTTDPACNPQDAVGYVLSLLPPEFSDVTCYWQFSASQGMKGNTLSLHLWFFLDRSYSNAELRKYAKFVNTQSGYKLIDTALFTPSQPHYTASPVFEGLSDPLSIRSGLLHRANEHLFLDQRLHMDLSHIFVGLQKDLLT